MTQEQFQIKITRCGQLCKIECKNLSPCFKIYTALIILPFEFSGIFDRMRLMCAYATSMRRVGTTSIPNRDQYPPQRKNQEGREKSISHISPFTTQGRIMYDEATTQ